MGNFILKCWSFFRKNEAVNISDMKLELPKGLKIRDKREIFMLKFPFYQMEVAHFHQLMKSLQQTKIWTVESELFEIFKDIEDLEETWVRVKMLLKADVF